MHVFYTPGIGFSWSPTVLDIPSIKTVHGEWSDCGLHYICLFGHPLSVHARVSDLAERDKSVQAELRALKLGKPGRGGNLTYPADYYKQPSYQKAEPDLLMLQSVPDVTQVAYLKRKLSEYQKQSDLVKFSTDTDEYKKQVATAKDLNVLIKQTANDLSEAEGQLQKLISQAGVISLDALWNGL